MIAEIAEAKFQKYNRKYSENVLLLARLAAVPIAVTPELIHLLHINFLPSSKYKVTYFDEIDFLLSDICIELDNDLYEIPLEIRKLLIKNLVKEQGENSINDIALFLWEYSQKYSPWQENVSLERAQQLTALSFIKPRQALEWLNLNENQTGQFQTAEREWYTLMRKTIRETGKPLENEIIEEDGILVQVDIVFMTNKKKKDFVLPDFEVKEIIHIFSRNGFEIILQTGDTLFFFTPKDITSLFIAYKTVLDKFDRYDYKMAAHYGRVKFATHKKKKIDFFKLKGEPLSQLAAEARISELVISSALYKQFEKAPVESPVFNEINIESQVSTINSMKFYKVTMLKAETDRRQLQPLVFISYAWKDNNPRGRKKGWLDWLLQHLKKPLEKAGIELFIDNTIITGEYSPKIKAALERTTAAILLLSPAFMDSDYIIERELPVLIARYQTKKLVFFPLLVSECAWDILPVDYLDPLNNNNKAQFMLSRLLLAGQDPKYPLDSLPDFKVNSIFKATTKRILAYHENIESTVHASIDPENPSWAASTGKDEYGTYADFTINGVTQRMRWIEPGEFLMGSPPDEPERSDNEYRHRVILTKGFWLADTACTQRLWHAVMKKNPSHFKGDDLPVETVSWDMVIEFIEMCNLLVPGLNLRLPTEAEWEYACRAGTPTPFFFGKNITTDQVNYNGMHPYNKGKKGKNRKKTVAVMSLPCNKWGLYQMHGNVWEWCSDWYDKEYYKHSPLNDPRGPDISTVNRVLRGGGWWLNAGRARSACRYGGGPSDRVFNTGLRLARGPGGEKQA